MLRVFDVRVWPAAFPAFFPVRFKTHDLIISAHINHLPHHQPDRLQDDTLHLAEDVRGRAAVDQTVYASCLIGCLSVSLKRWGVVCNQAINLLTEQTARPHATVNSHCTRTCPICEAHTSLSSARAFARDMKRGFSTSPPLRRRWHYSLGVKERRHLRAFHFLFALITRQFKVFISQTLRKRVFLFQRDACLVKDTATMLL